MSITKIITHPTAEHISLDDARLHLRLDAYDSPAAHPDDPLVTALITSAREWAETFTGRSIGTRTVEIALDAFPRCEYIPLPMPPLFGVQFVRYYDTAGVEQTFSGWVVDDFQLPPRVQLAVDAEWPDTQTRVNAVRVRYQVGYPVAGESPSGEPLPESIRSAMLLVLAHLYEHREDSTEAALSRIPLGAESLLTPYRLFTAV